VAVVDADLDGVPARPRQPDCSEVERKRQRLAFMDADVGDRWDLVSRLNLSNGSAILGQDVDHELVWSITLHPVRLDYYDHGDSHRSRILRSPQPRNATRCDKQQSLANLGKVGKEGRGDPHRQAVTSSLRERPTAPMFSTGV
jgi:hypothetical protein